MAHARAWASTADGNVYSRAHPEQWVDSPDLDGQVVGLPISSKFWDSLFDSAKAWGCLQSVYKTDTIQLNPDRGYFLEFARFAATRAVGPRGGAPYVRCPEHQTKSNWPPLMGPIGHCTARDLARYQQDWMYTQEGMEAIRANATLSRLWHLQMTDALQARGMRFGFGGVQPTDWLMSVEQQAVTNGRASLDYSANLHDRGAQNWNIGAASIFCWALSVMPAKDGWWTTESEPGQAHYHDNRTEPFSSLHGAVASLSRGPVSPADRIGLFNRTLIMRACTDNGTLLTPDRPALALDSTLLHRALHGPGPGPGGVRAAKPNGEVWATTSTVAGVTYRHVLVPLLRERFTLFEAELRANDQGPATTATATRAPRTLVFENAFDFAPALAHPFDTDDGYALAACDRTDFKLLHTVPILANGWGLVGEPSKWVPISPVRVRSVHVPVPVPVPNRSSGSTSAGLQELAAGGADTLTLELAGAPGEHINFGFVKPHMGQGPQRRQPVPISYVSCTFGPSGRLLMQPTGCTHP